LPITLREPLPTVPIPPLPGDADVPLELQQAMNDGCAYGASIDYSRRAEIPLSKEEPPGQSGAWPNGENEACDGPRMATKLTISCPG
jgi:hypothetical protein